MSADFAKLLNNCMSRIDGSNDANDESEVLDNKSQGLSKECEENSNIDISPIRSGIKVIIEEKFKQRSPLLEKDGELDVNDVGTSSEVEGPDKAKILFSLKDFFDRSKESENKIDDNSSGEDEEKDDQSSEELDKNVEALYNKDHSQDDDDIISESDSDLEDSSIAESSDSDKESDTEDLKGDEPDQDSDLESELNLLEKLKQKLDNNIISSPKCKNYNDESVVVVDEVKNGDQDVKSKKEMHEENNDMTSEGSGNDPINIDDDIKDNSEQVKEKEVESVFKNISISVVGGNSKNISIESLLSRKPPSTTTTSPLPPKQSTNIFHTGPSISIKRKEPGGSGFVLGSKKFKKSSLLSSDEESPGKRSVPTVTLDENVTIEDISDDDKDTTPTENVSLYDNCIHGDLTDYMCVDCTYSRWRGQWVKPVKRKSTLTLERVKKQVNPVEIIQAVNWEKVFKFAGFAMNGGDETKCQ